MEAQWEGLWYCAFLLWSLWFFCPCPPSLNNCIDDPRLKVRVTPERQEKDKYTHAEVRFEHPARGNNTFDECAHFIRGSLGGWHVGGCEIVKDPIEPEDWCNKFNASLVKPLKTLKLTSRLTPMAAWIPIFHCTNLR